MDSYSDEPCLAIYYEKPGTKESMELFRGMWDLDRVSYTRRSFRPATDDLEMVEEVPGGTVERWMERILDSGVLDEGTREVAILNKMNAGPVMRMDYDGVRETRAFTQPPVSGYSPGLDELHAIIDEVYDLLEVPELRV